MKQDEETDTSVKKSGQIQQHSKQFRLSKVRLGNVWLGYVGLFASRSLGVLNTAETVVTSPVKQIPGQYSTIGNKCLK